MADDGGALGGFFRIPLGTRLGDPPPDLFKDDPPVALARLFRLLLNVEKCLGEPEDVASEEELLTEPKFALSSRLLLRGNCREKKIHQDWFKRSQTDDIKIN